MLNYGFNINSNIKFQVLGSFLTISSTYTTTIHKIIQISNNFEIGSQMMKISGSEPPPNIF